MDHQDGSCLARHCECVSIKTLENEGWKQLSTETKENLGDDLSKLDQAAQWVEDKTKPNYCTNYGGECKCTGIVQMGFKSWKHGTVWWGSRLNFRTNDCPGGGGGGYSCASVKCDKSEFGDPYPDVRKANLLSCRCLPLDLSKDARKQRQETVAQQCIESIVEPLSKGDLDSKDADATCADLAKYIANEEVYARAMDQQWLKQRNRHCEANELGRIIKEAFEAIGDAIMSAFFFKDTVGGCLKYWMEKVSGAIDPILNPILKVLQFDKLFDPIKKVILDAMQPLLDILNVELPALPELPAVPEFPDLTPDLTKLRKFLEKIRVDFPKELTCAVSAHGGQREARL